MIQSLGSSGPSDPRRTGQTDNAAAARAANTASSRSGVKGKTETGPDVVDLSPQARDMQQILRHLGDRDAVRAQRVEELRRSIQAGTYRVDPDALAGKILDAGLGS